MHVLSEIENNLYAIDTQPQQTYQVAETKFPYLYWTERHLQVMWWERKYFKNLKTSENLPIRSDFSGDLECRSRTRFS